MQRHIAAAGLLVLIFEACSPVDPRPSPASPPPPTSPAVAATQQSTATPTPTAEPSRIGDLQLQLYFPPDIEGADQVGNLVRITGRFDDPRASTCRISLESDQGSTIRLPDSVAIEYCRRHFVVESLTILGPDPDYVGI